jgi:CelD/BcsL family acetyltransferase involved in cellulose biosynthesis
MHLQVITTADEFTKLRAPWKELHCAENGTLFQLPEWHATWWELYGANRGLQVQTYWSDGLMVGVIPVYTQTKTVAHVKLRRSSFMGDVQAHGGYCPLVDSGCADEMARHAGDFFKDELKTGAVDILDFNSFPAESKFMGLLASHLHDGVILRFDAENYPHIVNEGPVNGEAFLKSLPPKRRHGLQKSWRHLVKAGVEITAVTDWDGGKAFDDLVRLHVTRWNQVGQEGRLSLRRFSLFLRSMVQQLMPTGNARIYLVRFQGESLAAHLMFRVGRRWYGYVNGRHPTHELMHYSVGDLLTMQVMTDAFDEGCDLFDLMGGDYPYKYFFGTARKWYARATAVAPGLTGAKGALYLGGLTLRDTIKRLKRTPPPQRYQDH